MGDVIGHGRDESPGHVEPGPPLPTNRSPSMRERAAHDAPLYRAAARVVCSTQFGSARLVARKLGITPYEAHDLMLGLEGRGYVGPSKNGLARDVLVRAEHVDAAIARDWPEVPR